MNASSHASPLDLVASRASRVAAAFGRYFASALDAPAFSHRMGAWETGASALARAAVERSRSRHFEAGAEPALRVKRTRSEISERKEMN